MFLHKFEQATNPKIVLYWFMLSFNGGFINAGGFLATGKFVSHVTGFATLFGVELVLTHLVVALSLLIVPLFFLLGAFVAGIFIDLPLERGRTPHYDYVMIISSICLCIAANFQFFHIGSFGNIFGNGSAFLLLALLCLACGLQNGAITSSSVRSVRTTHLTGITTDLGLGIARLFILDRKKDEYQKEIRSNQLRSGSIFSFVFGSAIGAFVFSQYGYHGFYIPALITAYAALHGRNARKKID